MSVACECVCGWVSGGGSGRGCKVMYQPSDCSLSTTTTNSGTNCRFLLHGSKTHIFNHPGPYKDYTTRQVPVYFSIIPALPPYFSVYHREKGWVRGGGGGGGGGEGVMFDIPKRGIIIHIYL